MRANKVEEKDEQGNQVIGTFKRGKALFGFVPCLELLVEALYEVVGNVIVEALHTDVLNPMQRLNRHPVGKVTVADNSPRRAKGFTAFSMVNACGLSLWRSR